jgi:NAD(P)-dependent dehydrogenase (short-subunit alcohol dehydrogenase family)
MTLDLVNNAGYGLGGAFEDLELEEMKAQFETNLFGLITLYMDICFLVFSYFNIVKLQIWIS